MLNDLGTWLILAGLTGFVSAAVAPILGTLITFFARRTLAYQLTLFALFFPFAVGPDVWAFGVEQLLASFGIKHFLVNADAFARAASWCIAASVRGLGVALFFVATVMQARAQQTRRYCLGNGIGPFAFTKLAFVEVPRSVVFLAALFAVAVVVVDSALPFHLYRANPGTPPEALNLALLRLFRELYPIRGEDASLVVLRLGFLAGGGVLTIGIVAAWCGLRVSALICQALPNDMTMTSRAAMGLAKFTVLFIAGVPAAVLGMLLVRYLGATTAGMGRSVQFATFVPITLLALSCSTTLFFAVFFLVIRNRLSAHYLSHNTGTGFLLIAAALLFVPATALMFGLGRVFALANFSSATFAAAFAHTTMLLPIVVALCHILARSISQSRIVWFQQNCMSRGYVFVNEGVRGYPAYCVSVVGLGAIQIVTDGVVSRWFSTIFPSPAEQFAAAAFGRSATALAAYEVSIVVLLAASAVSYVIALAYSLEISAES